MPSSEAAGFTPKPALNSKPVDIAVIHHLPGSSSCRTFHPYQHQLNCCRSACIRLRRAGIFWTYFGESSYPSSTAFPTKRSSPTRRHPHNGASRARRFVSPVSRRGRERVSSCSVSERSGSHRVSIGVSKARLFNRAWGLRAGAVRFRR